MKKASPPVMKGGNLGSGIPHGPPFVGGGIHVPYKPPKRDLTTRIGRFLHMWDHTHGKLKYMNDSKVFAGMMVVLLNVSTKFVPFRLSKSMERFMKESISRNILVFATCWVGTRDLYIALFFTAVFILCFDFLFNEDSEYCILSDSFVQYHHQLADEEKKALQEGHQDVGVNNHNHMGVNKPPT